MSGVPHHQKRVTRDDIWAAIRQYKSPFDLTQLVQDTHANRRTASSFVECLEAGGYLRRLDKEPPQWTVLKPDLHTPRLRKDGTPVTQGGGNENMWRTMRMLKEFTSRDIAIHATTDTVQVAQSTAKTYCTMLLRTGYLRVVQKAQPPRLAVYRLIRNTGPKPPQIQRVKQVWDPNTHEVHLPGAQ